VKVHTCDHPGCGVRLILAKGVPALNAFPDPLGTVAARQTVSGAWVARFLARDEEPDASVTEHRYSVHECDGTRRKAQRAAWKAAVADLHKGQRNRRGKRGPQPVTGVIVRPERLPGMGEQ
jgi:hypothetical protein